MKASFWELFKTNFINGYLKHTNYFSIIRITRYDRNISKKILKKLFREKIKQVSPLLKTPEKDFQKFSLLFFLITLKLSFILNNLVFLLITIENQYMHNV